MPVMSVFLWPAGFGHMTEELRKLAAGKLVLSLEGGYHLPSISDCTEICVRALLGEQVGSGSRAVPRVCFAPAVRVHIHIHIVC